METKNIFGKKSKTGYDYDGVIDSGVVPEKDSVIITGRPEKDEAELRELLPDGNDIYFFPSEVKYTNENESEVKGKWKGEIAKKLGLTKYYDDNEEEAKYMQEVYPEIEIVLVMSEKGEKPEIKEDSPKKLPEELKFIILSAYGELLDVAIQLEKVEKYETIFCVLESEDHEIGEGIVTKEKNWHNFIGKGYVWVVDGCEQADLQDWLREKGEYVVGTNKKMAEYENDRQKGQKLFKDAGFYQPMSKNFTNIDDAIKFVKENPKDKYILKQNGDLPKSVNHKSHFDDNIDMIFHLEELKKGWSETTIGKFDCDLMTCVDGMEVAVSAFFNGHDFLRNSNGKIIGFINHEQKKAVDGDLGVTCGEMGTIFNGVDEDDKLFKDILLKPEIIKKLKDTDYRGVFDINCIVTDDGIVGLEPTSRFGIPATSYEFIGGLNSNTGKLLASMAMGIDDTIDIEIGWGIAQVIVSTPFPVEADIEESATSLGEKLWIIGKSGKPIKDFTSEQLKHIHLENFKKDDKGNYIVPTKNGYLLTLTGQGKNIKDAREKMLEYIKQNVYISDMWYRQDLGKNVEKYYE